MNESLDRRDDIIPKLLHFCLFLLLAWCAASWVGQTSPLTDLDTDDEFSMYLQNGMEFHTGGRIFLYSDWGPLYALWYAFLFLFQRDPYLLNYLSMKVVLTLAILSGHLFLRRMNFPPSASIACSIVLILNPYFLEICRRPNQFALILLFLFFYLSTYFARKATAWWLITFAFWVVSYVRPEYLISAFISLCFWIWYEFHPEIGEQRTLKEIKLIILKGVPFLLLPWLCRGLPYGTKSLSTFLHKNTERHYLYKYDRSVLAQDPEKFANQLYHNPSSIPEAIINNFGEFSRHISFNIKKYLQQGGEILYSYKYLLRSVLWSVVIITMLSMITWKLLRGLKKFLYFDDLGLQRTVPSKQFYILTFLSCLPMWISCVLFGPLHQYSLGQLPFFIFLMMAIVLNLDSKVLGLWPLAFIPMLGFFPPEISSLQKELYSVDCYLCRTDNRRSQIASFLRGRQCSKDINLMTENGMLWKFIHPNARGMGMDVYLRDWTHGKRVRDPSISFWQIVDEEKWNVLVVSTELWRYIWPKEAKRLKYEMYSLAHNHRIGASHGFSSAVNLPAGATLLIKDGLAKDCPGLLSNPDENRVLTKAN